MEWKQILDESSGQYYFFNESTGEASWDQPVGWINPVIASAEPLAAQNEWISCFDENTGMTYYSNSTTGEVSWEIPNINQNETITAKTLDDSSNWIVGIDEGSGSEYYTNKTTGESQWDKPACLIEASNDLLGSFDSKIRDPQTEDSKVSSKEIDDKDSNYESIDSLNDILNNVDITHSKKQIKSQSMLGSANRNSVSFGSQKIGFRDSFLPKSAKNEPETLEVKGIKSRQKSVLHSIRASPMEMNGLSSVVDKDSESDESLSGDGRKRHGLSFDELCDEIISSNGPKGANDTDINRMKSRIGSSVDSSDLESDFEMPSGTKEDNLRGNEDLFSRLHLQMSLEEIEKMLGDASFENYVKSRMIKPVLSKAARDRKYLQVPPSVEQLLSWQPHLISSPLLKSTIDISSSESVIESDRVDFAVKIFKRILGFMGDRPSSSPPLHHGEMLLKFAIDFDCFMTKNSSGNKDEKNMLSDEIYCQICKQLIGNPSAKSIERGWQLLILCLAVFPPSLSLAPYLIQFCLQSFHLSRSSQVAKDNNANNQPTSNNNNISSNNNNSNNNNNNNNNNNVGSPLTTTSNSAAASNNATTSSMLASSSNISTPSTVVTKWIEKYSKCTVYYIIRAMNCSTFRRAIPSTMEMESLWNGSSSQLKVYFVDDSFQIVEYNSWTTVSDVLLFIQGKLGINSKNSQFLGLFEAPRLGYGNISTLLEESARIVDILARWNQDFLQTVHNSSRNFSNASKKFSSCRASLHHCSKFICKVRYYFDIQEEEDGSAYELLALQAMQDLSNLKYPLNVDDACFLAALYIAYEWKDLLASFNWEEIKQKSINKESIDGVPYEDWMMCHPRFLNSKFTEVFPIESLEQEIFRCYKSVYRQSPLNIQHLMLNFGKSLKLFGCTIFTVESNFDLKSTSSRSFSSASTRLVYLAVSHRSIALLDRESYAVLVEYRYDQLVTWGYSFNSILIVVGSRAKPIQNYYRTSEGKQIHEIIGVYVEYSKNK